MLNVKEAVKKSHTLVVYYSKGEVGECKIEWSEVAAQSLLRDQVLAKQAQRGKGVSEQAFLTSLSTAEQYCLRGLGGSQKGEVAWLDMMGYKYEERDVNERLTGSLHVPNANREGGGLQVTATEWRAKVNSLLQLAHIAERKPGFLGS